MTDVHPSAKAIAASGWRAADPIGIVLLVVGWLVMETLVNPVAEFPLNDDWIYAGAAKSIVEQGHFWIPGPAIPNLFAQAYWGALCSLPFGFSFTALRVSTLILGLTGVLALYWLLRRLGGAPRIALLGAATLAVNPVYFNLSNTFMTDVPFLCLTIVAILFIERGLTRSSPVAMLTGLSVAFVAILVRQTGLFILIGFALAYPVRYGFRLATVVRGALPLLVGTILHVGFQHWVIATGRAPDVVLGDAHALIPASLSGFAAASTRYTILAIPYLGAFVFPFVIMSGQLPLKRISRRQERAARIVLVGLALLFMALVVWKHDTLPVLRNVIFAGGVGPLTLRDVLRLHIYQPAITPTMTGLWLVVTGFGVAGAFLLFDRVVRGGFAAWAAFRAGMAERRHAWLYVLTMGTAGAYWAGILLLAYWDAQLYDRYILYFVPLAIIAVLGTQRPGMVLSMMPGRALLAAACVVACAGFAVVGTHDYLAWNRSRWQAVDHLITAEHVAPNLIDGGYEFNGWMQHDPRYAPRTEKVYFWADESNTYVVAFGPIPGYDEIGRYPVQEWLFTVAPDILVLRKP